MVKLTYILKKQNQFQVEYEFAEYIGFELQTVRYKVHVDL